MLISAFFLMNNRVHMVSSIIFAFTSSLVLRFYFQDALLVFCFLLITYHMNYQISVDSHDRTIEYILLFLFDQTMHTEMNNTHGKKIFVCVCIVHAKSLITFMKEILNIVEGVFNTYNKYVIEQQKNLIIKILEITLINLKLRLLIKVLSLMDSTFFCICPARTRSPT